MEIYGNETKSIMESPLKYQRSNVMKKQNVETIVLKNAKTGVAEKIQHECHNTGYGTKHFLRLWKRCSPGLHTGHMWPYRQTAPSSRWARRNPGKVVG